MGARHPSHDELVAVCWAVAARDCAIERGDAPAAARFAEQARDAIDAALAAGTTLPDLAYELDYPGGAVELDGPHIDQQTAHLPAVPATAATCHDGTAAVAVADAHHALASLTEPAAGQTADDGRAAELADRGRHDEHVQAAADDDGDGWS
jgi:hypothetical protein